MPEDITVLDALNWLRRSDHPIAILWRADQCHDDGYPTPTTSLGFSNHYKSQEARGRPIFWGGGWTK
jgi:hypothetical protein